MKFYPCAGSASKYTNTVQAGRSRFWRAPGNVVPVPNADAVALLPVFQYLPHSFEQRAWSDAERSTLKEQIQMVVQVPPRPARP